jgi:uncharacterized protein
VKRKPSVFYSVWILSGLLFGLGLGISGMLDPQNVFGFLDFFGTWNPRLAIVLGVSVMLFLPFHFYMHKKRNSLAGYLFMPKNTKGVTPQLLLGSVVFGIGWGLSGMCPGPNIASLGLGNPKVYYYFATMLISTLAYRKISGKRVKDCG